MSSPSSSNSSSSEPVPITTPVSEIEPFLTDNGRYTLFPIRNDAIWKMAKKHEACIWHTPEIKLGDDLKDWDNLTNNERYFISHVLAFFAGADGIVMENIDVNFSREVTLPEARIFYAWQNASEAVHTETYSLLIQTLIKDEKEKDKLFDAINRIKSVKEKANWAKKFMDRKLPFAERLIAFAVVEGVFFSGSFCSIFWLKKRGKMPGLSFSNELISRDEGLHCEFACLLFSMLKNKPDEKRAREIVSEAVIVEKMFICESLPVELIGMNSKMMSQYIELVADRLLLALGYSKIYHTDNPFEWMELISLQGKTNMFEKRIGEYQKSGVMEGVNSSTTLTDEFTTDADY